MKKIIIEGNDETRVVWYLNESLMPYYLEVYDKVKGWRPLMVYDTVLEALDAMKRRMEDRKRKEEE